MPGYGRAARAALQRKPPAAEPVATCACGGPPATRRLRPPCRCRSARRKDRRSRRPDRAPGAALPGTDRLQWRSASGYSPRAPGARALRSVPRRHPPWEAMPANRRRDGPPRAPAHSRRGTLYFQDYDLPAASGVAAAAVVLRSEVARAAAGGFAPSMGGWVRRPARQAPALSDVEVSEPSFNFCLDSATGAAHLTNFLTPAATAHSQPRVAPVRLPGFYGNPVRK